MAGGEKKREVDAPCFTTRVTNFRERAHESESEPPRAPKLPPVPGSAPDGGAVDPDQILNRKK